MHRKELCSWMNCVSPDVLLAAQHLKCAAQKTRPNVTSLCFFAKPTITIAPNAHMCPPPGGVPVPPPLRIFSASASRCSATRMLAVLKVLKYSRSMPASVNGLATE